MMSPVLFRKSQVFLSFGAILLFLFFAMFAHARFRRNIDARPLKERRELVGRLELTDLCLFTEARYTRHPGMADLNTPFQDYPMSLEHFPSGSLMIVPPHLKTPTGNGGTPCY